jgi:CheY-like chemotaxis protein
VDDETDARELFASIVKRAGGQVTTASSAAEALHRITVETPHVLVSDIEMPDQDGYQLLAQIRNRFARRPARPLVVAVTAYARAVDRTRALDAGFDWYLAKPVEPGELVATLASLVNRHGPLASKPSA